MSFIGTREEVAYTQGALDALKVASGQPAEHSTDNPYPFFYERGFSDQKQGFPLVPWNLVTATALTDQQRAWYLNGYARGVDIRNKKRPSAPPANASKEQYDWITAGTYDGQEGRYSARYVITTEARVAKDYDGSGPVIVVPAPSSDVPLEYKGAPIYEVAAYFAGRLVTLDAFLSVSKYTDAVLKSPALRALWVAATRFEVLGDAPGEDRQGYRLSGTRGPVAKYLVLLGRQSQPPFSLNPRDYGLPAWFVTKTTGQGRKGIRFLSRRELLDLGIDPDGDAF